MKQCDELTLPPFLGEQYYKRLLAANLDNCPEIETYIRLPRSETRYGWPRDPQPRQAPMLPRKARQIASALLCAAGKLLVLVVIYVYAVGIMCALG